MNRTEVLPGVWHLEEDYRVYCTLVQGKTLALLWDTGQGRTDLAAYVAQQVPTPCLVLNSHGHSDHIGGNFRFPQVYAHRADWPLLAAYARLTGRETPVCPLEPGQCFALGGRRAEVISLAGHTKGSVGLLLAGEGLLLAGDGLNQTLLLLGAEAAPLSQLRQTLEAVLRLPFAHYLSAMPPTPCPRPRWRSICITWTSSGWRTLPAQAPTPPGSAGANTGNRAAGRCCSSTGDWQRRGSPYPEKRPHAIRGMGPKA